MDNFFRRFERKREITPNHPAGTSQTSGGDWEGRAIRPTGRSSLLVPAWHRGVTLIMQTMGQMVIQYQRMNKAGGNFIEDRYGTSRSINYLLQIRPNPLMTASQMQEQIEFQKIYKGNAYVYIERNDMGDPVALWLCTSGNYNQANNTYSPTYLKPGKQVSRTNVPASDMLHFKSVFLDDNLLMGLPIISYASKALSIAATADEQTLKDMAKGGKHKILVQEQTQKPADWGIIASGRADQSELKRITDQLEEDWLSKDAVFLSNMADAKIISQTAAELRTLENRGFQVADIARILGVPRIMMMDDGGGASYKTPEAATQEFLLRTIQPRVREMEDELNAKLLDPGDFGSRRIHVCEQALRRLDPQAQANLDKIHLETGAMCPNEIRSQYDLGTIPDGDKFYVSTNLAVVGSKKLSESGPSLSSGSGEGEKGGEQ